MKANIRSIPVSVILFLIVIASLSIIPDVALEMLDHAAIRVLLIVLVLVAMSHSTFTGILALLAIAALLIQRNHRKTKGIVHVKTNTSSLPRMKEDADMPVSPSILYPEPDEPSGDVLRFEPFPDTGSNEFTAVNGGRESIDYKVVPESAPLVHS
jgi:hypothetical protein